MKKNQWLVMSLIVLLISLTASQCVIQAPANAGELEAAKKAAEEAQARAATAEAIAAAAQAEAGEAAEAEAESMADGDKPTVIHLMTDEISPESQAFYRAAAADFEAAHPNVSISLDFQGNMDQALAIRVAAGEPPEIASMQLERLLYYADQGLLEPADWWFEKYGDDVVELY
jgi:ABC-type glycerol-3-phosphate transport system substrate-binding protein